MKELKVEEQWDKKKIILFIIVFLVLLGIGYELKRYFLDKNSNNQSNVASDDVKGASTQSFSPAQSIKQNIQGQIDNLRNEAQNINLVDVASSSPQVQKVINDLKALQNYPSNQLKDVCEKVCSGL